MKMNYKGWKKNGKKTCEKDLILVLGKYDEGFFVHLENDFVTKNKADF